MTVSVTSLSSGGSAAVWVGSLSELIQQQDLPEWEIAMLKALAKIEGAKVILGESSSERFLVRAVA